MIFRRLLHLYFLLTRALTLGVRAAIRTPDGKFILVRHTYTPGWHFPGGGVEKGEIAIEALRREVSQEVAIDLRDQPSLLGVYYNRQVSRRDHVLLYLCAYNGALPTHVANAEIECFDTFGLEDLPADIDPGTERRIREIVLAEAQGGEW